MSHQVIKIGIDLGTSRSAISASNGRQGAVDSYVGWPIDSVARKVVGHDVLVGREALDHRLMLDLHRPLERGLIKEGSDQDTRAVRHLVRCLLEMADLGPDRRSCRVDAVVGVPAEALRVNRKQLRHALSGLVDSMMIVSEPFAVAYGLEALVDSLIIDIGAGTSDFCIMQGRYPRQEDQRTLALAGDTVDDHLYQSIAQRYPEATLTRNMVKQWKETYSFVGEAPEAVWVTAPVEGRPIDLDITDSLRTACESLLPAVTETMLDLVGRVDPDFQERVRQNVILSGGSGLIRGFGLTLQRALEDLGGGTVRVVADPLYVGADGGLALALDAPPEDWDRLAA